MNPKHVFVVPCNRRHELQCFRLRIVVVAVSHNLVIGSSVVDFFGVKPRECVSVTDAHKGGERHLALGRVLRHEMEECARSSLISENERE